MDAWDASWPATEPRPPNWNCSAESRADHHGSIATNPMLTREAAEVVTGVFKGILLFMLLAGETFNRFEVRLVLPSLAAKETHDA